ncbi:MAG: haloacid dehalogenase-like hydrolase [Bacteroidales bacterium]|nr:haloacid dehalogenase-like hydrolase [Bacteroidales bacterium]MCF8352294.1 haloacid dehalogenase-like hydrolase [Bacteroidales bacterium]MCF8377192.1 haloacid dehalogenase-like hydrolase [Bacteroidales bacterium]MCF8401063.1 haloacid dehalogenase-like hydrolase [Bacteroidales bacterium]
MEYTSPVKLAIAYDFDGTLVPGNMQEHSFIPKLGIDKMDFWKEANDFARKHDMDDILSYMQLMLQKAGERNMPISRNAFMEHGRQIKYFKGVEGFFDRINAYAAERHATIEHYVISSGIRDIIRGTSIARHFKNIFASGFVFDKQNVAVWPALAINYTNKTQYLFRINKGIYNSWDNTRINEFVPQEKRPMPFSKMIYIGDGLTDVPAMKMIKYQGGTAIAVYDAEKKSSAGHKSPKERCEELIQQKRADFIAAADYSNNSRLVRILQGIINRIVEDENLKSI